MDLVLHHDPACTVLSTNVQFISKSHRTQTPSLPAEQRGPSEEALDRKSRSINGQDVTTIIKI